MADANYSNWRTPGNPNTGSVENTPVQDTSDGGVYNTGILFGETGGEEMNVDGQACIIGADVVIEGDVYTTRPIILQGVVTGAIRTSSTVSFDGGTVQKNIITFTEDQIKDAQEQIKERVSAIQLQNLKQELDDRDSEAHYKSSGRKSEPAKTESKTTGVSKAAAPAKETAPVKAENKSESAIIPE